MRAGGRASDGVVNVDWDKITDDDTQYVFTGRELLAARHSIRTERMSDVFEALCTKRRRAPQCPTCGAPGDGYCSPQCEVGR